MSVTQTNMSIATERHMCPICHNVFGTLPERNAHMQAHVGENLYRCFKCGFSSSYKSEVSTHALTHIALNVYRCTLCSAFFGSKAALDVHLKTHVAARLYKCAYCEFTSSDLACVITHMNSHIQVTSNLNQVSNSRSMTVARSSLTPFSSTQTVITNLENYRSCQKDSLVKTDPLDPGTDHTYAGMSATPSVSKASVIRDVKEKVQLSQAYCEDVPLENDSDGNTFDDKRDLVVIGSSTELNVKPVAEVIKASYDCFCCKKDWGSREALAAHKQSLEIAPTRSFRPKVESSEGDDPNGFPTKISRKCPVCQKVFIRSQNLTRHMKTHPGKSPQKSSSVKLPELSEDLKTLKVQKPHECPVCSKRYSQKSGLYTHMNVHLMQKPYKCSLCSMRFSYYTTLDRHMLVHTGKRAHKCTTCSKCFQTSTHLKTHMMTHTGVKPYQCSLCGWRFSEAGHCRTHVKRHTPGNPFGCVRCKENFIDAPTLRRHVLTHTEKRYKCDVCSRGFVDMVYLRRHMKVHEKTVKRPDGPSSPSFKSSSTQTVGIRVVNPPREKLNNGDSVVVETSSTEEHAQSCFSDKESLTAVTTLQQLHVTNEIEIDTSHTEEFYTSTGERNISVDINRVANYVMTDSSNECSQDLYSHTVPNINMEVNTNKELYLCVCCDKEWKTQEALTAHEQGQGLVLQESFQAADPFSSMDMQTSSGEKPHKCSLCSESFDESSVLQTHMKTHTGENSYECTECNMTFSTTKEFRQHKHTHIGKIPQKCTVCRREFRSQSSLRQHLMTHTGERPHECLVCSRRFTHKNNLSRHMLMHTGERAYKCATCSKYFQTSTHLKTHMRTHTGEKPFQCSVCSWRFSEAGHCRTHMKRHTGQNPYRCCICSWNFTDAPTLRIHMRIHTGEPLPYKCSVCKQQFINLSSVHLHMKTHTGETPHKCTVCGKCFPFPNKLKYHMMDHAGERPHKCIICNKTFKEYGYFKAHVDRHSRTTSASNRCLVCGKQYQKLNQLKIHMYFHTREKTLIKCSHCSKVYPDLSALKHHMLVHISHTSAHCEDCVRGFTSQPDLEIHLASHLPLK